MPSLETRWLSYLDPFHPIGFSLITPDFHADADVETRGDCAIPSRKRCRTCGGYLRSMTTS